MERATLYGLPIVAGRKVAYGRIDPELSRSLFIRRALVEGDWDTRHEFFTANRRLLEEVEQLEHRARRRDIVADDQALYDFYDARIPADVVSGAHFDRWWKDERRRDPDRLTFTREDLVRQAGDALDERALPEALGRELEALRGVRIPREAWDLDRLPPHLRMTFRVEDERGALVAEGPDLDALREAVRPRLREALSSAAAPLERHGLTAWTMGALPKTVALPGTGQAVRGNPSLADEGATVGVRVLETPAAQAEAMHAGTRKLLALNVPSPIRHVQGRLGGAAQLALAGAPHASPRAALEDATVAALEDLMAEAGGPAWDAAGFDRLRDHVAGNLTERTAEIVDAVVRILDAAREVELRLERIGPA